MRARVIGLLTATLLVGAAAPATATHLVDVDMTDRFNADVVVNGSIGSVDTTQQPVDNSSNSWITQSLAEEQLNCVGDADGLPDNGIVPESPEHPRVRLGFRNGADGKNAFRSADAIKLSVGVPRLRYKEIHVFLTSASGATTMQVKLNYVDNPTETHDIDVADWWETPAGGAYSLIADRDRAYYDGTGCHNTDAGDIWGYEFPADKTKKLKAVRFVRPTAGSVVTIYGITGASPAVTRN